MTDSPELSAIHSPNNIYHSPEAEPLHTYDGEIVRQQLTVAMIAAILLNETIAIDAQELALRELRLGSQYSTIHWRNLQMHAQHIVKQHKLDQATKSRPLGQPELNAPRRPPNQWYVDNQNS